MALANYSDLTASVANWLHRSDLTSIIPDLVTIAEARLSSDLKARDMDVTYPMTLVAGTNTVATPTDMVELRRLQITSTDPKRTLVYLAPDQISTKYPYATVGIPEVFTVIGPNFELAPIPDIAYSMTAIYSQRIPSLQTNTTNWLMTKWPHAYLYATLCAAAPYLGQDQRVGLWEDAYQKAVDDINSVDWFSGSPLVVRTI
jgi:hypothetical protein